MKGEQLLKVRKELQAKLDKLLDEEYWFQRIENLADKFLKIFEKSGNTQLSNLEVLSQSTQRYNDIIAYVMRQTGKDERKKERWAKKIDGETLGKHLIDFLIELRKKVDEIVSQVEGGAEQGNWARLYALKICMRNLNSAYRYKQAQK